MARNNGDQIGIKGGEERYGGCNLTEEVAGGARLIYFWKTRRKPVDRLDPKRHRAPTVARQKGAMKSPHRKSRARSREIMRLRILTLPVGGRNGAIGYALVR